MIPPPANSVAVPSPNLLIQDGLSKNDTSDTGSWLVGASKDAPDIEGVKELLFGDSGETEAYVGSKGAIVL